ncbi:hypothetical protein CANCADRAFT_30293 [Tortispora caseinolytica NRRL Y-17796]|uniref:NAD(P)-binding protein n=1 Tax=Tortispora caseinolytica NRRL Y-17796 TaxID=767744 RepID=A0A1E4TJR7_9ASCO|nr:hypothetical protein CANCADRAFT_30293 [Tortispora caseinolytica NRRL Y-17796]
MSSFNSAAADRLSGKTVLITGASAGIGEATAKEFAVTSNGNIKLVLTARRVDRLNKLRDELKDKFPNIQVHTGALDMTKTGDIPVFVENLPKEFSEVDVLVNNAGMVFGVEKVGEVQAADIDVMFATNVIGLIALTQAVIKGMRARNRGDIINLGSIAGLDPYPGGSIYCATKAAIRSFTESLRKESIDTRIRVMEVDPGQVETEFSIVRFRGDTEKAKKVYEGAEPLVARDIAEYIVFIASRRENTVFANALIFPNHQASARDVYKKN